MKAYKELYRIKQLAVIKAIIEAYKKVTRKKLYFIDIPIGFLSAYRTFSPILCKRRIPSREIKYTSTNGSRLMYTMIELDAKKLKYFDETITVY
jgi:hypothetical protein